MPTNATPLHVSVMIGPSVRSHRGEEAYAVAMNMLRRYLVTIPPSNKPHRVRAGDAIAWRIPGTNVRGSMSLNYDVLITPDELGRFQWGRIQFVKDGKPCGCMHKEHA
jgi:hypothetical protein